MTSTSIKHWTFGQYLFLLIRFCQANIFSYRSHACCALFWKYVQVVVVKHVHYKEDMIVSLRLYNWLTFPKLNYNHEIVDISLSKDFFIFSSLCEETVSLLDISVFEWYQRNNFRFWVHRTDFVRHPKLAFGW